MAKTIEISRQEVQELLDRVGRREITEDDYDKIKFLILTVAFVNEELSKKNITIKRLRKVFAIRSEKSKDILPAADKGENREKSSTAKKPAIGVDGKPGGKTKRARPERLGCLPECRKGFCTACNL